MRTPYGVLKICLLLLTLQLGVGRCGQELVDKMFEALSVTSPDIQREIISCLPEVIDDMQHVDVAHKLK